jgi:antimicrobial peptide system SdpA family protein
LKKYLTDVNLNRATFIFSSVFFIGLILIVLLSSVEENNLPIKGTIKLKIKKVIPQGWSFFTRNPKEEDYYIYKYDSVTKRITNLNKTLNSSSNFLGLKRICANSGIELSSICRKIKKSEWQNCKVNLSAYNFNDLNSIRIVNFFPGATINGTYIIQKKSPIPFEWVNTFKGEMPSQIALLKVVAEN